MRKKIGIALMILGLIIASMAFAEAGVPHPKKKLWKKQIRQMNRQCGALAYAW